MAREHRGGYYKMDHESFGRMMVSEQFRPALVAVSNLIKAKAKANTEQSGTTIEQGGTNGGRSLADAYETQRGPILVLVVEGRPSPRITHRVVNTSRHAAVREFGRGGWKRGRGTRDLRRAGEAFGDLAGERG